MPRQWVRVRDRKTGHQFSVREDAFRTALHELVDGGDLKDARRTPDPLPAKPKVSLPPAAADGTVDQVLAVVGDDPELAAAALEAELAKDQPRTTLTAELERLVVPPSDSPDAGEQSATEES